MPILTIPNEGFDAELHEFNQCHNPAGAAGGRFCSDPQGTSKQSTAGPTAGTSYARPKVLQVRNIDEALRLIRQGKAVELPDTRSVNTLLHKLAKIAQEAKRLGKDAPDYDLCNVSVKGTNLFCHDRVRTAEHPEGIKRIHMPQFTGEPVPGSPADKLPKDEKGEINAGEAFIDHLKSLGIETTRGVIPAAKLKASQSQLVGPKVAKIMSRGIDPRRGSIFTSRDNYVIDGHHRWAAVVGLDAEDNALGDIEINEIRVDAPISEVLQIAKRWTREFGIKSKEAKEEGVVKLKKRKKAA